MVRQLPGRINFGFHYVPAWHESLPLLLLNQQKRRALRLKYGSRPGQFLCVRAMDIGHPQQVVVASLSGSPELKRQKCEDDDVPPDLELDGLVAQQDDARALTG